MFVVDDHLEPHTYIDIQFAIKLLIYSLKKNCIINYIISYSIKVFIECLHGESRRKVKNIIFVLITL